MNKNNSAHVAHPSSIVMIGGSIGVPSGAALPNNNNGNGNGGWTTTANNSSNNNG